MRDKLSDRAVLLVIAGGLIVILLSIVIGLFLTSRPGFTLPNWAENVLVAIATASALKLGDCLATLVALSQGKQIGQMGTQLANAPPTGEALDVNVVNPPDEPVPTKASKP